MLKLYNDKQCIVYLTLHVMVLVQKVEVIKEKFTFTHHKKDKMHTAAGSWCFGGLSVEVARHKGPVSSYAVMYCFDISSQCLCFGNAII